MKPIYHSIISAGISTAVFKIFNSWESAFACLLTGIFIDIDHFFDFFMSKKRLTISYKELEDFCSYDEKGKVFLLLHSYEFIFLLFFLNYFFKLNFILTGIALGAMAHVLCDQFSNPLKPFGYFFLYRIKNSFRRENLFTKKYLQLIKNRE